MIPRYRVLQQRIAAEIDDLERTQQAAQRHWQRAQSAGADQDAYVNSVALNLHSFYSGLERILELIAVELDGGTLGGADWHTELLQQMTLDLKKIRPSVLARATAAHLDEYRKFRHRVRNIYAMSLDPVRMQPLVEELPALWTDVRRDLSAFAQFLDALAEDDQPPP